MNTVCCKLGPQASKHIMDKERKAHPQRESKKILLFNDRPHYNRELKASGRANRDMK